MKPFTQLKGRLLISRFFLMLGAVIGLYLSLRTNNWFLVSLGFIGGMAIGGGVGALINYIIFYFMENLKNEN